MRCVSRQNVHDDRRTIKAATLVALLLTLASQAALGQKKPAKTKPPEESLAQFVERHFARWDRDHNDVLEVSEVDHFIENHSVRGRQAALAVCLRRHMTRKGSRTVLPHEELLVLVKQPEFAKSVANSEKRLATIDRELFLPADPNLDTFNQGRLNDCYLLAGIAGLVHRSPKAVREMIHPEVTGGFIVVFGDGQRIEVPQLTESELLLGAKLDSRHGSWLAVLEKAYGIIRKRQQAKKKDKTATTVPEETLNFGHSGATISLLTGRQAERVRLGKSSSSEQVHKLLIETTKKRRLVCADTGKEKLPPGLGKNHSYAVLGYDRERQQVNVFNPWGNNFKPKGPAGLANGYSTMDGRFVVPLDQFQKVFSGLVYETNHPSPQGNGRQSRTGRFGQWR